MSKIRKDKQKQKKKQYQEENLDSRTAWGTLDPTPAAAVKNIKNKGDRE